MAPDAKRRTALYASVGRQLTQYDADVEGAAQGVYPAKTVRIIQPDLVKWLKVIKDSGVRAE